MKCFHIKFQPHKEIIEGDNQRLELDSRNKVGTVSALGHIVFLGSVQRSHRERFVLAYVNVLLFFFFFLSFEGVLSHKVRMILIIQLNP